MGLGIEDEVKLRGSGVVCGVCMCVPRSPEPAGASVICVIRAGH
jgi:hypothetical protein